MNILPKNEIHSYTKDRDNIYSLWNLINFSNELAPFKEDKVLSNIQKELEKNTEFVTLTKNLINGLNYRHHNDALFEVNFKEVFTNNNEIHVLEGQEDVAVLVHNNISLIFRTAEPGVNLTIKCPKEDILTNVEDISFLLKSLIAGFDNPKEFKALLLESELKDSLVDKLPQKSKFKI